MGSTRQPERSLASGIPIPRWMKTKMNDRFDLEDTAFSPPNQDDSFFYMRYPKHHVDIETVNGTGARIVGCEDTVKITNNISDSKPATMTDVVINKENNHLGKTAKSLGGEEMFRGEGGYGHSIVQVAHQMISGGLVGRPGFLGQSKPAPEDSKSPPPTQQRTRRGSKSLPASPLTTPDSTPQIARKNRYFTSPFVETDSDRYSKYPASWFFAGVLGTQREASGSRDTLDGSQLDLASSGAEKPNDLPTGRTDSLRRNKSVASMLAERQDNSGAGVTTTNVERPKKSNSPIQFTRPKPSELRELNFWSPTSM